MAFDLSEYVDVAERIHQFKTNYPDGSLQSELVYMTEPAGWLCTGFAYRTADDLRPGVGHAFEPVPGKTPYTKDSEAQNAETAAWGRAIVALGFETKKIASRQEVKARQTPAPTAGASRPVEPAAPPSAEPLKNAEMFKPQSIDESLYKLYRLTEELGAKDATQEAVHDRKKAGTLTQEWVDRCIATAEKNLKARATA